MNSRARRAATFTTGAGAVLAFVALLIPQVADALSLTTAGKILAAFGIGFLTACGQRLVSFRRARATIQSTLRVWPPEPLGHARLSTLGVYPAHDGRGRRVRYQPRSGAEDGALADALRSSRTVIVHGPAGCGKSRAISHAAAAELPDVPVVIPLDAPSLNSLLDGGVELPLPHPELCLWLDGLDRFTEVLDPCSVESAQTASKPAARIVATLRSDEWTALVHGTGQDSEAARALAQDATIVELSEFTPVAPGDSDEVPAAPAVKTHGVLRDPSFLGLLGALLAVIVVGVILNAQGQIVDGPSINDQIEQTTNELLAAAGPGGGHVILDERVPFHSTDQPSWLIVVQDLPTAAQFNEGAAEGANPKPRSDDVRIYDVVGDRLQLKLHFRPQGVGLRAAEWESLSAGAPAYADYAEDGSEAVIGGFALPSQATSALLPVAIKWQAGRYVLVPLTPDKPDLGASGLDAQTLRFRRAAYEAPLALTNAVRSRRFARLNVIGYRVQTFALAREPTLRLLTAYFSRFPVFGKAHALEIHASQIRPGLVIHPCEPGYFACPAPAAAQDAIVPPDKSLDNGLLKAWNLVSGRFTTRVRVVPRGP
jgi:hypothetical protein